MSRKQVSLLQVLWLRFPLRLPFWVLLGVLLILHFAHLSFEVQAAADTSTTFYYLIQLLVKIAFYFVLGMLVFATVSVAFSYLLFQFGKKKYFSKILIAETEPSGQGFIKGNAPLILQPFLGKLQAIVWFKGDTEGATLLSRIPVGKIAIPLPVRHIKVYEVAELDILFLDLLRMYRLPASLFSIASFEKTPTASDRAPIAFQPLHHQDEIKHTDQIIYNKGEWLQYKPFESGDDVRRVLWKIYAKSKELMVRQQELYTHYSSKVSILVLFDIEEQAYASLSNAGLFTLLDAYKNAVYSIYQQVVVAHPSVSFTIMGTNQSADMQPVLQQLTAAKWHAKPRDPYQIPSAAWVIVPSLLPAAMIPLLQAHQFQNKTVLPIPLLSALPIRKRTSFLRKLFFKTDPVQAALLAATLPASRVMETLNSLEESNLQALLND